MTSTWVLEWTAIAVSGLGAVLAVWKGLLDYKRNKDYGAEFAAAVMCLCFLSLSLAVAQESKDQERRTEELKRHIDSKLSVDVEIAENPSETDVLKRITTVIEEDKQDPKLRLMRVFSLPGPLPGLSANQDTLVANTFKAYGFRLTYVIAFPWDNSTPSPPYQVRQREMGAFLVRLMTNDTWTGFSQPHLSRKELFHVPSPRVHDSWAVLAAKRSRAGLVFTKGEWGGAFDPAFEAAIFVEQPSMAGGIARDINEMRQLGVAHLTTEMAKPAADRCPCTLFAGAVPDEGLKPTTREELEKRATAAGVSRLEEVVRSAFK